MTLLFIDAVQDSLLVSKPEYAGSTLVSSAQTGRDSQSTGCARLNGTGANIEVMFPTAAATAIVGSAWKLNTTGANTFLGFMLDSVTIQTLVWVNSSGFIEARRTTTAGTLLGTSSGHAALTINSWFHITAKVVLNASSAGSVIVQLNGVTVLTVTGVTTAASTASVTRAKWFGSSGNTFDIDDIYVCDAVDATATQGRTNNDFLGDLRVQALFPTSAGDTTAWTPSTGSNFATVDEVPPNTTDYVSATTSTTRDLYNISDLAGTILTVYAVRETLYLQKTDSGALSIKPVIKENSTVTVDTAQAPATGQFGGLSSTLWTRKPSGPSVWTSSDVNGLQVGQEIA